MAILALLLAVIGIRSAFSADAPTTESARGELEKWVETHRVIAKERREWAVGKEMLGERIALVKREIESTRMKVQEAQASITEADKKRTSLAEENEKLKQASASLTAMVAELETKTKHLLKRLPDHVRNHVKLLSQQLPDNSADTKLSLSVRFQNVVGVLNAINKFNREINMTSEVRALPDGTSAEVTAIYIGISQAYYVGGNGKIAGVGFPSEQGWTWKPANEHAQQIADVVAIMKNEKVAAFVQLPIEVK